MKKLIVTAALIATLGMAGHAGAVCVTLGPYCDQIELGLSGTMLFGAWDYTCAGDPLVLVMGTYYGGIAYVSTWLVDYNAAYQFQFSPGTMRFDMFMYVPGAPPTQIQFAVDFSFVPGDCPFAAPGLPMLTSSF